jgi:hypothetical protein
MMIKGTFRKGIGKAHFSSAAHTPFFGRPMHGTFNVKTRKLITDFPPSIEADGRHYWRLILNDRYEAWAFRWTGSRMPKDVWELVSAEPLPAELRHGEIMIEIPETKI